MTWQHGPLMFPLRSLLHARAFTFGWSTFLALFYFTLGVVNVAATNTRLIGLFEIIFSLMFFLGAMFFARRKSMQH